MVIRKITEKSNRLLRRCKPAGSFLRESDEPEVIMQACLHIMAPGGPFLTNNPPDGSIFVKPW